MIPTMEEVAGWLRKAALSERAISLACSTGVLPARFKHEADEMADLFDSRAAQVEAMGWPKTCDTCEHWGRRNRTDNGSRGCGSLKAINIAAPKFYSIQSEYAIFFGPKFGCIHHEDKQQIKESK